MVLSNDGMNVSKVGTRRSRPKAAQVPEGREAQLAWIREGADYEQRAGRADAAYSAAAADLSPEELETFGGDLRQAVYTEEVTNPPETAQGPAGQPETAPVDPAAGEGETAPENAGETENNDAGEPGA